MLEDVSQTGANKSEKQEPKKPRGRPKNQSSEKTLKLRTVALGLLGRPSLWLAKDMLFEEMFGEKIAVINDKTGQRRFAKIRPDNVVQQMSETYVHASALRYLDELARFDKELGALTPKEIATVARFVELADQPMSDEDILPVALKSDKQLAYARLAFDLDADPNAPTPTFDELFSRMSNATAIRIFIGSLFDPKSSREQYPYIYGEGENGKGRLVDYLIRAFGEAGSVGQRPENSQTRWFNAYTHHKRFVGFGECDDFKFAVSETMKIITGSELVLVDNKSDKIFMGRAICKFMFASNRKPAVENVAAHRRRLIYAEMSGVVGEKTIPTNVYDKLLDDESHAFLTKCHREYLKSGGGKIDSETKAFDNLLQENEADFHDIADMGLIAGDDYRIIEMDARQLVKDAGLPSNVTRPFLRYLVKRYGLVRENRKVKGVCTWGWWGVGLKRTLAANGKSEPRTNVPAVGNDVSFPEDMC